MDFQEELKVQCEVYASRYNFARTELGRGFEGFVVHLCAADGGFISDPAIASDPMTADLKDYIFRQNEGGVDGYLEDEGNKVIMLVQAKYLSGKKGLDEDDL